MKKVGAGIMALSMTLGSMPAWAQEVERFPTEEIRGKRTKEDEGAVGPIIWSRPGGGGGGGLPGAPQAAKPASCMYPDTKNITGNDLPEVRQGAARQLLPRIGLTRSGTYRVKWSDGTIDVFVVSAAGSPAVLQYTEQQGDGQAGSNC